jgi:uncharacterized membrane protein
LAYLTFGAAGVALWATLAPRSWYEDFPGAGKTWVSVDGPYNEHLVRDVGAFELGMLVLGIAAIVILSRDLVRVALVAFFVSGLPHAVYHMRHPDPGGNGDPMGVVTVVALPLIALVLLLVTERWQQPDQRRAGTPRPRPAR